MLGMVQTVYSNQLEVVLSRLDGMTYEEAKKYYNRDKEAYPKKCWKKCI